MESRQLFGAAFITGVVLIVLCVALTFMEGSPYRYGRMGGQWWLVQLGSGALLLYGGGMGHLVAVSGDDLLRMQGKPWVVIVSVSLAMALLLMALSLVFLYPGPVTLPTHLDYAAAWTALGSALLALFTGGLALYYATWQVFYQRRMQKG